MVTGFEIAGVVLAALPLLVSASEHHDLYFEPINAIVFKKERTKKYHRKINESNLLYRQCCEKMLSIAEVPNISELLSNTTSDKFRDKWSDPGLESMLKITFGEHDLNVIKNRISEIHDHIIAIKDISSMSCFMDVVLSNRISDSMDTESGRVKQAIRSRSQVKHAEFLKLSIEALRSILEGESFSVMIGTTGTAWQNEIDELKLTRSHLLSLYETISDNWGCTCKSSHVVNFQHRDMQEAHLSIILSAASARCATSSSRSPWALETLCVTPSEQVAPASTSVAPNTGLCDMLCRQLKIKEFARTSSPAQCRFSIYSSSKAPDPGAIVSLRDSLGVTSNPSQGLGINITQKSLIKSRRDGIVLGARLLITVLQQHSAPWFRADWTVNEVYLRSGKGCSLQPYLEASFDVQFPPSTSKPFKPPFSKNATLYNLGVALIEVAMHDTMDNMMNDEDRAAAVQMIPMARAFAAYRISRELSNHLIPVEYRNAVRICLTPDSEKEIKGNELSDDDLFDVMYRKAAKPLIELIIRD